ncbi:LamG-like jellyroll fold domain-containing protein [Actinoplanes sp. NPDC026619]|uniref:LamG-like jellyroll fold domain-containing protein n=1 Tax=Actinoplanes sp. NPDC026619 TaxID=3155798 RepID=UPI0034069482
MLTTTALGVATPARADVPTAPSPTTPPAAPPVQTTPDSQPAEPADTGPVTDSAKKITAAIDEAKKTGATVPIPSLTDAYSMTSASPDGTFATTYSITPERVQRDGKWTPVDTTLIKRADGSFAPKAAVADVSFGGGGDATLVTLKQGTNALKFSWTGKLPAPVITEDTATYPNVLPDVDLQVTASATGYSSVFVVKTPQAAANPKVQRLDLGLAGTRVKIAATRDGGAEAKDTDTGRAVFRANTALMWDSTPSSGAPDERAIMEKSLTSPRAAHEAASLVGKNKAKIKVGFAGGKQSLTLDKTLLTAKTTKYPVFVDPDWGVGYYGSQSSWARISSNGWNVYNSTATTGSNSARIGLDNWPTGDDEKARTYYKMNLTGIKGATVKTATLYVKHRWSANCSNTNAVVYATGAPAGFSSSTLYWGKEPSRGSLLDTKAGKEVNCGTSSPAASPASFAFNVSGNVASLAKAKKDYAYFLVEAANMSDKYSWKQLGYKGGASLTVRYSYPPTLKANDGKLHVTPNNNNEGGKLITTSRTPTLSWGATNTFPNGVKRNLMVDYHVEKKGTGELVAYGYGPGATTYNANGSSWTVNKSLPDGDYQWRVTAKNQDDLWTGTWGPYMYFSVDATAPNRPSIKSTQFPPNQVGAGFTEKGVFALGNDKKNNVTGYLFTLDGDLTNVVYASNKGTQWVAGTTIKPGTIYYAKADNKEGTGTVVTNGSAAPVFAPATAGAHKLSAKAVDAAGSTSSSTVYEFNAGTAKPLYVTGDQMINGYTGTNADGTTTTVPKATATSTGGALLAQTSYAGYYFVSGYQAMLANNSATGTKVASGDSATFSFNVPQLGLWELGANMLAATDYGAFTLTLDQGRSTQSTLITAFDAYSALNGTVYKNFATPKDANGSPIPLDKGVHTVTLKLTGKNAASAGYQAGIDALRLNMTATCPINDTRNCLNNKAISTWNPSVTPAVTDADADGWGFSLNAANLAAVGWAPGATLNVHGAAVKLPATWGDGKNDNMLSASQLITLPGSGVVNKGNAVVFLGFAVNGDVKGASGRITYAKDSGCNVTSQAYTLDWVVDWAYVPAGNTVVNLPWRNKTADGTAYIGVTPSIMAASVPLVCPGAAVSSVSLPLVSDTVEGHVNALHILGLGIRPTSSSADGARWVGSWATAQDTGTVPDGTLNTQTVRIPAHLTIGAGTDNRRVRVRIANTQGKTPVTFDAASIALQDASAGGATATDAPVPLTFGGAATVTLPAGTDVLSDPVALAADDQATVLVSLKVKGKMTALAGHKDARSPVYVSAADNANHTTDTAGSGFTLATMGGVPYLAGVDVSTPADNPAGAVVLYGDATVNSDTANNDGLSQISDQLATALSSDEYGNRYPIRAGVLNQGSSSWGNSAQLPTVANTQYPQNSYGLIDREILNQTGARIVLVSAGSSDLLACTGTAAVCASAVSTKLNTLAGQLQNYRIDDALNFGVSSPTSSRTLKVYVATLPAFSGTHTAAQEAARQLVNTHILGSGGPPNMEGYADGVIDFAAAVSVDGTAAGATVKPDYLYTAADGVSYPSDLYYQTLAWQYVLDSDSVDGIAGDGEVTGGDESTPVAEWKFNEQAGATTAPDTGGGTGTFHDADLFNVGFALGRDPDSRAGTFNGTSSYADTKLPFNTARSYTVEAWVRLTDKNADRTILARNASGNASLYFQYNKALDRWIAQMPSATAGDADSIKWAVAPSDEAPKVGVWTHLAAVYDASVNSLNLYVNGNSEGGADEVTSFNDPDGASWIGRDGFSWFAGDIADVRVWSRPLGDDEIQTSAAPRIPAVSWQFEDQSLATTAPDSSGRDPDAPGAFTGGVTWKTEGHPIPDGAGDGIDQDRGAITLNGTNAAVTTRARLRTDQSFTVAGWARITDLTRDQGVVSQYGAHASGFQLNYGATCKCWRFLLPATDGTNPTTTTVQATTAVTAGAWVHLAAVYNATTATATLYVGGTATAPVTVPARTWNSTGLFTVGRVLQNDAGTGYFAGDVDDISAYQDALTTDEINNLRLKETPQG